MKQVFSLALLLVSHNAFSITYNCVAYSFDGVNQGSVLFSDLVISQADENKKVITLKRGEESFDINCEMPADISIDQDIAEYETNEECHSKFEFVISSAVSATIDTPLEELKIVKEIKKQEVEGDDLKYMFAQGVVENKRKILLIPYRRVKNEYSPSAIEYMKKYGYDLSSDYLYDYDKSYICGQ